MLNPNHKMLIPIAFLMVISLLGITSVLLSIPSKLVGLPNADLTPIVNPWLSDPRIKKFREAGIELDLQSCNVLRCFLIISNPMALGDFVMKVGAPEKIYGGVETERRRLWIDLFYFREGFFVYAGGPGYYDVEGNIEVRPDLTVYEIHLWNSRTMIEMKNEISQTIKLNFPLEEAQEWRGFGRIKPLRR